MPSDLLVLDRSWSYRRGESEVLVAPFAVHAGDRVEVQPDVLVGRDEDFTDRDLRPFPVRIVPGELLGRLPGP